MRHLLARERLLQARGIRPLRIVVGASGEAPQGWLVTEQDFLNLLDPTTWQTFFDKPCVDAILAEHVWEHLTLEEGRQAARVCFDYLRPGGYARVAVPDGLHPDPAYRECVRPGGSGAGADDHKVLYTHGLLSEVFESAGFTVSLLEYFDASGTFHYVDWDPDDGLIVRSRRFDERNCDGHNHYTSIIIDAVKPGLTPRG
ncbi:MAG TPA: hypothetical protein VM243_09530 [Phycisphaerae bacterium]|nr:hypothetical protein [Phycisphaerae bacterium]